MTPDARVLELRVRVSWPSRRDGSGGWHRWKVQNLRGYSGAQPGPQAAMTCLASAQGEAHGDSERASSSVRRRGNRARQGNGLGSSDRGVSARRLV